MVFVAAKLFWMVARPSVLLLLLVVLGLAWRRARAAAWVGAIGLALLGLLPSDLLLLRPLEDRFPQPAPPAHVDGIVILGGAVDEAMTRARGIPSLNDAAERMTQAAALARRYPDARVVFSGGSGRLMLGGGMTESDAARMLWDSLGVDPARTAYEDRSRTTWENAVFTRDLVRPKPGETWLLVTSASHMPRSMGIFRAVGWPVTAWPVGYKTSADPATWTHAAFPERLAHDDWAMHEWIGLLAYRLLGRTDALFPGP